MVKLAALLIPLSLLFGAAISTEELPSEDISLGRIDVRAPKGGSSSAPLFRGFGICYSPYTAAGQCKSQHEIDHDLSRLKKYSTVRIYGVDCNQVPMVLSAAKRNGMQVFAGIFNINNVDGDLHAIINAARHSWHDIAAIAIGNELVNKGYNSPDQVVGAVHRARHILRSAGYPGPVVTVDTVNALLQHPQLCRVSDFCAANAHAFYSHLTPAHEAGNFARKQLDMVSAAAGGKRTIITESGWPSAGGHNGRAVPSDHNQAVAVNSLREAFKHRSGDLLLFSAFNDKWKKDWDGSFGAEKFWGIED